MNMIEDVANAAFDAVRAGDEDTATTALQEIISRGAAEIHTATRRWMDRAIVTMFAELGEGGGDVSIRARMEPDNSGTGRANAPGSVPPDVTWAGRMFIAYASRSAEDAAQLWQQVPSGGLFTYVRRMLTTMALTAEAYEEMDHTETCCALHSWFAADPALTGARFAKSHLN